MNRVRNLGQTSHSTISYPSHSSTPAVTTNEIETEFRSRGYSMETTVPAVTMTRTFAVQVAVDYSIDAFKLPRTNTHFYRCPAGADCAIPAVTWDSMVGYTTRIAQGFLVGPAQGGYNLPTWAVQMFTGHMHGGFSGVRPMSGWIQDNPWFVTAIAGALATYGQYLTAQQVKDEIQKNAPTGALTKDDIPALLAALQSQGAIMPGQEGVVERGVQQAVAAPPWMMYVAIGGAALALVALMKK